MKKSKSCVVSLSGGQDSTTVLFWAKQNFEEVQAVSFDYEQKHSREIQAAESIAFLANVPIRILDVPALKQIGGGGLTNPKMGMTKEHPFFPSLPASFVPLRNLILLGTAAAFAIDKGIRDLASGVCQTDYSGYPDCRRVFIDNLEWAIRTAIGPIGTESFTIHTPLMEMTKKESVILASTLPGCWDALGYSHTCYNNQLPPCGECPACLLRQKGFDEAGLQDPLMERAEGIRSPR